MTTTPDGGTHLSPEQLQDLLGSAEASEERAKPGGPSNGQPDGNGADAGAAAHLATCTACTDALIEQRRIRDLLRAQPDPGPMPDELVARIDSALAAAGRERQRQGGSAPDLDDPATVLPIEPVRARHASRLSPLTGRVAKAVVGVAAAALIGVAGYAALHNNPSVHDSADRQSATSAASAPKADGAGPLTARVQATGTAYTKANIQAKVKAELATPAAQSLEAHSAAAPNVPSSVANGSTLTSPAGLTACVNALSGTTTVQPLFVDLATFEGKPVAVIVLPDGSGRDVWVVSRQCAPNKDGTQYFAPLR